VPIHAAGVYTGGEQECCSDYVVSSYTPTLSALKRAREGLVVKQRESLTFMVAAARTSPGMAPLFLVQEEAAQVGRIAAEKSSELIVYGSDQPASVQDVEGALLRTDIVHLACHGVQDKKDPLQSGFCLGDGKLTVSGLMNIKLDRAFLAFLSACETAKGDANQPDQAIHLAAAMLFCGFRSVIGTMW
jgi:CHAT domain-containing protein